MLDKLLALAPDQSFALIQRPYRDDAGTWQCSFINVRFDHGDMEITGEYWCRADTQAAAIEGCIAEYEADPWPERLERRRKQKLVADRKWRRRQREFAIYGTAAQRRLMGLTREQMKLVDMREVKKLLQSSTLKPFN